MADISKYIKALTIQSAYLPDIYLPDPLQPSSGPPNAFLQALKPKITVSLAVSGMAKDVVLAPYGDPGPTKWPMIQTALLVGVIGVLGFAFYRQLKK